MDLKKTTAPNRKVDNYRPQFVPQALKVIANQGENSTDSNQEPQALFSNGFEPAIDLMTLVQLPVRRLKQTALFYVDVLGLALEYPERPFESNTFLKTIPRTGPGLHLLETPESEFRHLHGEVEGKSEEYLAFYVKQLAPLYQKLLQSGAEVVTVPSDGYMSFFDPEGHLIGVYERKDISINERFESNITGFRHVQMYVSNLEQSAAFLESALGFQRDQADTNGIYMAVTSEEELQPMIRLVQAADSANPQPMHWNLNDRPKHALELHSKNIGALMNRVVASGGSVKETLDFTGCGGYLKFYTPDGHYIWVNQDRKYCDY